MVSGSSSSPRRALDVEWERRHPPPTCPSQTSRGRSRVDLDPVPVRVGEVDRLAHVVIGEPDEPDALAGGVREPGREIGTLGQEQGEVVEARVAVRGAGAGLFHEHEELTPTTCAEGRAAVAVVEHLETECLPVVRERPLEVRDGQVHRAHRRQPRDLRARRGAGDVELLGVARRRACGRRVHRATSLPPARSGDPVGGTSSVRSVYRRRTSRKGTPCADTSFQPCSSHSSCRRSRPRRAPRAHRSRGRARPRSGDQG